MTTTATDPTRALVDVLETILDLWPYINCVCGRNQPRVSERLRAQARAAVAAAKKAAP